MPAPKSDNARSAPTPAGLYIHIPFCRQKCGYCDFYSITDRTLLPAYLQALEREIASLADIDLAFDTLYIGGGTPSLLSALQVERLVSVAHQHVTISADSEITLEVNPGVTTAQHLPAYRHAGVNRLSIGAQSFHDPHLNVLGRLHSAADAVTTVRAAQAAGIENISVDLIYGIFDQTPDQLQQDLNQAIALDTDHISAYTLTIEPGTPLGIAGRRGLLTPMTDNQVSEMVLQLVATLSDHGYRQYEISNFARPGHRSRHNQKYWAGMPYIGVGAAAHSFRPPLRYWNQASVKGYLEALEAGRSPCAGSETLSASQQLAETVLLGLRTADGLDLTAAALRFGVNLDSVWNNTLQELRTQELLRKINGRVALTPRGMLVADAVTCLLLEKLPVDFSDPR